MNKSVITFFTPFSQSTKSINSLLGQQIIKSKRFSIILNKKKGKKFYLFDKKHGDHFKTPKEVPA